MPLMPLMPLQTTTMMSYLEFYVKEILAMQERYAAPGRKIPLAIMVSGDTEERTEALLKANAYFGMDAASVTIMRQEKVSFHFHATYSYWRYPYPYACSCLCHYPARISNSTHHPPLSRWQHLPTTMPISARRAPTKSMLSPTATETCTHSCTLRAPPPR